MSPAADTNDAVRFVLDGEVVTLRDADPTRTVLQYLREDLRRTGSKEGCAEGDCGACTVVIAEPGDSGDRLRFRAVNSCIQFVPTLDGKQLITVESLQNPDGSLHPVQRAMVDCHGSQCGFCTPGFVMSMFALYKSRRRPSRRDVDDALAGNLCRCTGYRPIVSAADKMYEYEREIDTVDQSWMNRSFAAAGDRGPAAGERETIDLLRSLQRRDTLVLRSNGRQYFAPRTLDELADVAGRYPDAHILAGGTDVGLWVTKQHRELDTIIYVGDVRELKRLEVTDSHIEVGAAVSLSDAMPVIIAHYPELEELFVRFASPPIRNAGTLGGNIANGSPIGDSMPALMTLGTNLVLRKGKKTRELPLDEFYLDYQKTARQSGEVLESIRIPLPTPGAEVRSYKISKRFDQDISAVCGAYQLCLDGGRVSQIRIAYGGVAAVPKRATAGEQTLRGREWNDASVQAAMAALDRDYTPISDMRASADYRRVVARNLLYRFYLETSGYVGQTRVYNYGR
ncbi:MAG: xanthine dehydrogenase small subunit [Gammaproteobacteria bacterium]